jgi:hypothetical protein
MIHIHVARTVLATAAKRYGPSAIRAFSAYRKVSKTMKWRQGSLQRRGKDGLNSFFDRSSTGTVPTIREWWQQ